jgi:Limiting CO2-inducible proteins B/C beta carbonyic anhydrases
MPSAADALAVVQQHYPDADPTDLQTGALLDLLQEAFGLPPSQWLLADSLCADEVNSLEYPPRASQMVGVFHLGGLDGFPHAGLTGMAAFGGHVPDGGGVVIYHAPHIGVSSDGQLGGIRRIGQERVTACCGAARAAVTRLLSDAIVAGDPSPLDYQQGTIEQILLPYATRIRSASAPLKEATEVIADAITERIDTLVEQTKIPARWLIRFGAILINGDPAMGSFSAPRRLLCTDLVTGETSDLLPALRGRLPARSVPT